MSATARDALQLLMAPGAVHELRVPEGGRDGTIAGYFDDRDKLARTAAELDGRYPGIYLTLNPCNPALLARSNNRVKSRAKQTTSDADTAQRRWFALDFDPVRPGGVSSTDYEHDRAIAVACGVWNELRTAGWGDPVVADSGNGAHLLYRMSAPNTPEITALYKRLLVGIAARCATDDVSIDSTVFNAARIWKLYGTLSCKGDSIPQRPHRRSKLLEVPDKIGAVPLPEGWRRDITIFG